MSFDFLIDGTGAAEEKREVNVDIKAFKAVTGFVGELHKPPYLMVIWGSFIMRCVLTKMDVKYTMFRADGTPLRATISATFRENKPKKLQEVLNFLSSPDVTHVRMVKAGDTLPLMCYRIYKDSGFYLEVARTNNLNSFRELRAVSYTHLTLPTTPYV